MESRATFLTDSSHRIRFIYTPKHTLWLNQMEVQALSIAVEAGMFEAEKIGELHAVMVIPNPLDDLDRVIPTASCWLEDVPEPLPVFVSNKEKVKELIELPVLETLPANIELGETIELQDPLERPLDSQDPESAI